MAIDETTMMTTSTAVAVDSTVTPVVDGGGGDDLIPNSRSKLHNSTGVDATGSTQRIFSAICEMYRNT